MGAPAPILILDGNNALARMQRVFPMAQNADGFPVGGMFGAIKQIRQFVAEHQAAAVIATVDWGVPAFRTKLCPEYKAQRDANRRPEDEKAHKDYKAQVPVFHEVLTPLGINVCRARDWEGDDCIAALVLRRFRDRRVVVWSSDRDFTSLVDGDRVKLWHPDKHEFCAPSPTYLIERCLDPKDSDNLDGVYGIGKVKAEKLLACFVESCGDDVPNLTTPTGLEAFLVWCKQTATADPEGPTGKQCAKVVDAQQKVRANFKVTCMHAIAAEVDEALKWRRGVANKDAFKAACRKYNLTPLLEEMSAYYPVFERLEQGIV